MAYLTPTQKQNIRLIAFDLDGTLLDASSHVSERTRRALEKAREAGYVLCAATGRVYSSLPEDIGEISAITHVISSNGAGIIRQDDQSSIYENLLDAQAVERIMPILTDPRVMLEVFFGRRGYVGQYFVDHMEDYGVVTEARQQYVRTTRTAVPDIIALLKEHIHELENLKLGFASPQVKWQINDVLQTYPDLTVICSKNFDIEIGGATTSKADALQQLCRLQGLGPENLMVFGDSNNDLAMLRYAGVSVAMGNSVDEVLQMADVVCPPNTEDGLAQVLEELLA